MPDSIFDRIDRFADEHSRFPVAKVREFIRSLSFSYDIDRYAKKMCDNICEMVFKRMPNHVVDGMIPFTGSDTFTFIYSISVFNPAKKYFQVSDEDHEGIDMLDNVIKECLSDMYIYTYCSWRDDQQLNMFNTELETREGVEYVKYSLSDVGEKVYAGIRGKLLQNGIDCVYTAYSSIKGRFVYYPWNQWNPQWPTNGGCLNPGLYYRATDQLIEYARKKGYM